LKISTDFLLNALRPKVSTCARLIVVAAGILLGVAQVLAQTPDPQPAGYVSDPARPARMAAPLVTEFREKKQVFRFTLCCPTQGWM
jgi:hypothetical protein